MTSIEILVLFFITKKNAECSRRIRITLFLIRKNPSAWVAFCPIDLPSHEFFSCHRKFLLPKFKKFKATMYREVVRTDLFGILSLYSINIAVRSQACGNEEKSGRFSRRVSYVQTIFSPARICVTSQWLWRHRYQERDIATESRTPRLGFEIELSRKKKILTQKFAPRVIEESKTSTMAEGDVVKLPLIAAQERGKREWECGDCTIRERTVVELRSERTFFSQNNKA